MNILVIDDEELIRWSLKERLSKEGHSVAEAEDGRTAAAALEHAPDLILLDMKLPDTDGLTVLNLIQEKCPQTPVIVITAYSTIETAVKAMKLGAYDYISKPFNMDELTITVKRALELSELRRESRERVQEHKAQFGLHNLIGKSKAMNKIISLVKRVAASDASTVLLRGESGTGKDLVAKALHYESARATKPFMNITCTALPETLLESELFGHEKGAFTDAKVQKRGLLELAHGGTVYLDEIGDMSPTLQAKILRALEERTIRRVGGSQDIKLDVRIIAATNRDLEAMITEKKFREDLYYRLNVITLEMPSLRDRRDDIPALVDHFLRVFSRDMKKDPKRVSAAAMEVLKNHDWPGNIRELRNVVERAVLLGLDSEIGPDDVVLGRSLEAEKPVNGSFTLPKKGLDFTALEKDLIVQALQRSRGNKTKAGSLLKMTRDQITYRLEKFGLLDDDDAEEKKS